MHLRGHNQNTSDCLLPQEEPRFHPIRWLSPFQCCNLQVIQSTTPTPLLALWKALQYPDNCFHVTNRFNSNFTFVMKGGPADDDNERFALESSMERS
jgi:hypothetical protein